MSVRRRIPSLILIMVMVAIGVGGIAIVALYDTAMDQQRDRLVETAQSQARLIEAIAQFDTEYGYEANFETALETTLYRIRAAHENFAGFGDTGEFTLAEYDPETDLMVFLLRHRHYDLDNPEPVPFTSHLAEPMRRALSGQSGTVTGLDYRGVTVLAAFEPVVISSDLQLGIVAKIDLAEVRDPFIRAGLMAVGGAFVLVVGGVILFYGISYPIVQKIEDSEEQLRSFMSAATDSFLLWDTDLNLIEINDAGLQLFPEGTREDDVLGKTLLEISSTIDKTERYDQYLKVIETGEPLVIDELAARSGDRTLTVRAFKVGGGLGMTITDVTTRKKLEIETRHAEILKVALEKEREVVALKERIISIISHEFRTPLTVIQTSSDLFTRYFDRLAEGRRKQLLQQIKEQITHMTSLIDNVLTIGRSQAGKIEFNPAPVDLEPFCRNIFEQIEFTDSEEHRFDFVSTATDRLVMADANLLQHVLTNLLTNAVKFSPARSKITFELAHNAHTVKIRIRDEGIGIPQDDMERMFEPFHRASNAANIGGTGLGLSIAKQYVELHGGSIQGESEVGKGSTFTVSLPARAPALQQ